MKRIVAVGAVVLSAASSLAWLGCDRSTATSAAAIDAGAPFDVETMAFLSLARAFHHSANLSEGEGDLTAAIGTLDRLVHARRPHGDTPTPEIEEVLADAYARKAELELRAGTPDAAAASAREGLRHAATTTYFRGHLLEVGGVIEESRAVSLADAGDEAGAARARADARRLLEDAVVVQGQVIEAALDGGTR